MNGELAATLNKEGLELAESPITASRLAELVAKVADGTLARLAKSLKQCGPSLKQVLPKSSRNMVCNKLRHWCNWSDGVYEVLANNAKAIEQFRSGNEKALNAIVGQVMKVSKARANPAQVQELIKAKLAW